MLFRLFLFSCLVAFVSADCATKWPNGTDSKVNWWQCGGDIQISSVTPQDKDGNYEYPIHLSKPLMIVTQANNPKNTYDKPNLKQTINVWTWGQHGTCAWTAVPTFGLLKNLDACTNGVVCPIRPGQQTLAFELDFSDYQQIINMLTDDSPYELQYILNDTNLGQAVCLTFQAHAYIH